VITTKKLNNQEKIHSFFNSFKKVSPSVNLPVHDFLTVKFS